jgi:pyruvate dehydrogenase E2 component (dihydrolipoamide acetyltransferase)
VSEGTSARGSAERSEPTKAERAAARRVAESKATIPHLYVQTPLELGSEAGVIPRLIAAIGQALRNSPRLNGAYRDGAFETYSRVNVGVLMTGPEGPIVPTVIDADQKSQADIDAEWIALSDKASAGSITARDVAGGTFTLQTGFGKKGCAYFPVINAGQAANLGVGSALDGVVTATLAADARMISGTEAAEFLELLQNSLARGIQTE